MKKFFLSELKRIKGLEKYLNYCFLHFKVEMLKVELEQEIVAVLFSSLEFLKMLRIGRELRIDSQGRLRTQDNQSRSRTQDS